MQADILPICAASGSMGSGSAGPGAKASFVTRLSQYALVLLALPVIAYGARWSVLEAPAAASEFVVATCIVDVVAGDVADARECTNSAAFPEAATRR
jgi:hypothetical protein